MKYVLISVDIDTRQAFFLDTAETREEAEKLAHEYLEDLLEPEMPGFEYDLQQREEIDKQFPNIVKWHPAERKSNFRYVIDDVDVENCEDRYSLCQYFGFSPVSIIEIPDEYN